MADEKDTHPLLETLEDRKDVGQQFRRYKDSESFTQSTEHKPARTLWEAMEQMWG